MRTLPPVAEEANHRGALRCGIRRGGLDSSLQYRPDSACACNPPATHRTCMRVVTDALGTHSALGKRRFDVTPAIGQERDIVAIVHPYQAPMTFACRAGQCVRRSVTPACREPVWGIVRFILLAQRHFCLAVRVLQFHSTLRAWISFTH